jgi:hypothetical protein
METMLSEPNNLGIVQAVEVRWTRASRGGDGAKKRAALPTRWALPFAAQSAMPASGHPLYLLHGVRLDEGDEFTPREQCVWQKASDLGSLPGLQLHHDGTALQLAFVWSYGVGAPERASRRLFRLAPGEWGQLAFNGRIGSSMAGDGREWTYVQRTYNVAYGPRAPDVFIATEPARSVSLLEKLL